MNNSRSFCSISDTVEVGLLIKITKGLLEALRMCNSALITEHFALCSSTGLSILFTFFRKNLLRCTVFLLAGHCFTETQQATINHILESFEQIIMHRAIAIQSNCNKICLALKRVIVRAIPVWKDFSLFVSLIFYF